MGDKKGKYSDYQEHRQRKGANRLNIIRWKDVKKRKVLDLGCNSGLLSIESVKHGAIYVEGYDRNRRAITIAQRQATMNGFDNIHFNVQDIDDILFQDSCPAFDVVFFCATIRGMKDRERAMSFAERVTKKILYFETNRVRQVFPLSKYINLLNQIHFREVQELPKGYERGYHMFRCMK